MALAKSGTPTSSVSQLSTILGLFIILRLTILFLYSPQGLFNAYTDYNYYFRTAQLSNLGRFPFINMWYEYPPLSSYLVQGVYFLTRSIIPNADLNNIGYSLFTRLLGLILLLFECGILILIHSIGDQVWGTERANWLAWVYATLSLPLFYWSFSHSAIVAFFLLLAVYLFIYERWVGSAFALGLGIAAKLTPVFMLAPAIKFLWQKPQKYKLILFYTVIAISTAAIIYLPFLLSGGGPWIAASFKALSRVGSWETIWAILDGNRGPGFFGPLESRLQIELASVPNAQPSVVPEIIKFLPFAIFYGWCLLRPLKEYASLQWIQFTTLTIMIFHLWSKGWSPQWATLVIPFLLLSFPNRRGLLFVLILTGLSFLETPIADTFNVYPLTVIAIVGRTVLFLLVTYLLAVQLWKPMRLMPSVQSD